MINQFFCADCEKEENAVSVMNCFKCQKLTVAIPLSLSDHSSKRPHICPVCSGHRDLKGTFDACHACKGEGIVWG